MEKKELIHFLQGAYGYGKQDMPDDFSVLCNEALDALQPCDKSVEETMLYIKQATKALEKTLGEQMTETFWIHLLSIVEQALTSERQRAEEERRKAVEAYRDGIKEIAKHLRSANLTKTADLIEKDLATLDATPTKELPSQVMKTMKSNTTHLLLCKHCVGTGRCTEYYMACNILKYMPDGRLKIEVFGDRNWKHHEDKRSIRYVEQRRVVARLPSNE